MDHDRYRHSDRRGHHLDRRIAEKKRRCLAGAGTRVRRRDLPADRVVRADLRRRTRRTPGRTTLPAHGRGR